MQTFSKGLAAPLVTWQQLLEKKVPHSVLGACCQLMTHDNREAAFTAQTLASVLITHAAEALPAPADGATSSSSGSGSSEVLVLLWDQIQQSGLLPHLPGLLSSNLIALQSGYQSGTTAVPQDRLSAQVFVLLQLQKSLQHLQSSLPTARQAGPQFLDGAMQLSMSSIRYVSTAFTQAGRQEWMEHWLSMVNTAANNLLRSFMLQQKRASILRSSSSQQGATLAALQSEHTLHWVCLDTVVSMLAQFLRQGTAPAGSSSGGAAGHSHRRNQQPSASSIRSSSSSSSAGSTSRGPRQPEALADSMPAAYSSMLEQLGCSREVGLWLGRVELRSMDSYKGAVGGRGSFGWMEPHRIAVMRALHIYSSLQEALEQNSTPQPAALHLSVAAVCLEWLSIMPPGRLSDMGANCAAVGMVAADACTYGQQLMEQQSQLPQQQQAAGDAVMAMAANTTVARLSATVLEKLMSEWRSLSDSGQSSTGGLLSSVSSTQSPLQPCHYLLSMLTAASATAPNAKLLQDCVRMAAHAAAAAAPAAPFTHREQLQYSTRVVGSVSSLLADIEDQSGPVGQPVAYAGRLVAPLVAAADVSSPDAMQLFGLLCSLLKAYSKMDDHTGMSAAVLAHAAVSFIVEAAVSSGSAEPGGSGSPSSCSCTAALPWLMLLGRCCYGCAAVLQHLQVDLEAKSPSLTEGGGTALLHRLVALGTSLQHLHASLACVVQWLAAAGTVQQLNALGYEPVGMQQRLAAATQALQPRVLSDALHDAGLDTASGTTAVLLVAVLKGIEEQLQVAGSVLATFAIPHACNNPACDNVCGPSEAQLVGGRSCICAGCLTARYCGRACQRAAWRQHKPVCKALAAAAAAAAATAAVPASVGGVRGPADSGTVGSTAQ